METTNGRGGPDHSTDPSNHDTQCKDPQPTSPSLVSSCPKKGRGQKLAAAGRKSSQQTGVKPRKQTQKTLTSIFTQAYPSAVPSPPVPLDGNESIDERKALDKTNSNAVADAPQLTPLGEGGGELGEGGGEVCFDLPRKPLTEVEEFKRRLTQHMGISLPKAQAGGVASILSKETITKLADTPGM